MKTLKTISILSLSAFLMGATLTAFDAQAKEISKKEAKDAMHRKTQDIVKSLGMSDAKVDTKTTANSIITTIYKPVSVAAIPIQTFFTAYEKAQAAATLLSSGLQPKGFYRLEQAKALNPSGTPPINTLEVTGYSLSFEIPCQDGSTTYINDTDWHWFGLLTAQ